MFFQGRKGGVMNWKLIIILIVVIHGLGFLMSISHPISYFLGVISGGATITVLADFWFGREWPQK